MIGLAVVGFFVVACVNDGSKDDTLTAEQIAFQDLHTELEAINRSFFGTESNLAMTRVPFWKKLFAVVFCDALGSVGGVWGAVGLSALATGYIAWVDPDINIGIGNAPMGGPVQMSAIAPNYIAAMATSVYPGESLGYYHNNLIVCAYNSAPSDFFSLEGEDMIALLGEAYEDYYNVTPEDIDVDAYMDIVADIMGVFEIRGDGAPTLGILPNEPAYITYAKELVPGKDSEWDTFGIYFAGLLKSLLKEQDIETYYCSFRSTIA